MSKKVTTAQIAKLAGVSPATVSRALNPKQSWRISKEKRDKIRLIVAGVCMAIFVVLFILSQIQKG